MKIRELVQDTALYGLSSAITRAFMLILIPVLISTLSVDEFGVISLFQFYIGIGIILFVFGMDHALIREFPAADKPFREQLLSTSVLFLAGMAILSAILFLIFRGPLTSLLYKDYDNSTIALWLLIIILSEAATLVQSVIFRAEQNARIYFRNMLVKYGSLLIVSWVLLKSTSIGLSSVFIAYLVSNILYTLFSVRIWKSYFRFQFASPVLKKMLTYGLPLLPAGLLNLCLFFVDHYLIQHLLDLKSVGLYAFGYKFGAVLYYLIGALNKAWYPRLFSMDKQTLEIHYHRLLVGVVWLSMTAFLIIDSAFRFFHPWFVPQEYWISVPIISLVGLAYIIHNMAAFADCLFFYEKKVGYIPMMTGISLVLNLGLNWVLIPRIGIRGAALATLAAFTVYLILVLLILKKLNVIPLHYGETTRLLTGFLLIYGTSYLFKPELVSARVVVMISMLLLFFLISWLFSSNYRTTAKAVLNRIKK